MSITKFLNIIFSYLIPLACAFLFILKISKQQRLPLLFILSLSYGLGTGIISQWMLILSILNKPFSLSNINALFIFSVIPLFLLSKNEFSSTSHKPPLITNDHNKPLRYSFIMFIAIFIYFIIWRGLNMPVSDWDAYSTDVFRAKIFFYSQSMDYYYNTPHNTYPLHLPLLQAWFSLNAESWNDQYVKIFYPLYSLSFLINIYYFLRFYTSRTWSLFAIVLLLSSVFYVFHSSTAYRDITLMYYNCTTILLLLLWQKLKFNSLLFIAALFAGFTTFVKLEGTGYLFIQTALLIAILTLSQKESLQTKLKHFFFFFLPGSLICLTFHLYKYFHITLKRDISEHLNDFDLYNIQINLSADTLNKFITVVNRYIDNMFYSNNWNIIWFILLISLLRFQNIKKQIETKLLLFVFFLYFGIYLTGYTLTKHYHWIANTNDVLSRSLLHFFPLACVLIILINFGKENENN